MKFLEGFLIAFLVTIFTYFVLSVIFSSIGYAILAAVIVLTLRIIGGKDDRN